MQLLVTYGECLQSQVQVIPLISQRRSHAPNGLRYLRWGGGRRSRPTRKMIRRRKLLEIAAESPASGARFVGQFYRMQDLLVERRHYRYS